MAPGEEYTFLCLPKMADRMDRVVTLADGRITGREEREYGVVISVSKT